MFQNVLCQTYFILILDLHKLLLRLLVVRINLQLGKPWKIRDPLIPDMFRHPVRKKRIPVEQETPLGNPVGLVVKLLGHHFIEILKFLLFQDFRVEPCNTVYGITGSDRKVGHLHLPVINDRHFTDLLLISGIQFLYL